MKYTVAIVEDMDNFREFLIEEIEELEDFECVGAYSYAAEALENIPALKPDFILMDLGLIGSEYGGIKLMMRLKQEDPDLKFVVITSFADDENVFEALAAGAGAYMLKSDIPDKLEEVLRGFADGGAPMSPQIALKVVRYFHQKPERVAELQQLTDREMEVLDLISKGYLNKEIKEKLNIAENTVKVYSHKIYEKLQVSNRVEATRIYLNL